MTNTEVTNNSEATTNSEVTAAKLAKLVSILSSIDEYAIAVSGGVDSMLMAFIANQLTPAKVHIAHAYSPAVPIDAFTRVKHYSKHYSWQLNVLDAQELNNENYVANPVNRCYFCKSNLYQRISSTFPNMVIISGTNTDDLSDYRPGLIAASEYNVRQVYVEAGISKADIYALASHLKLNDLHDLPAQPCLASRVETGIHINSDDLQFIDHIENKGRELLSPQHTLRCRITENGVYFEINESITPDKMHLLKTEIKNICKNNGRVFAGVRAYNKGAAFIHTSTLT